jgi:hypothetical protein
MFGLVCVDDFAAPHIYVDALLVVEFQTSDFSGNDRRLGERRIFYIRDDTKRANKDSNNRPVRRSPG